MVGVFNPFFYTSDILRIKCNWVCMLSCCQCINVMPDIGIFHNIYTVIIGIILKERVKFCLNPVYFKNSLLFGQDHHDLNKPNTTLINICCTYLQNLEVSCKSVLLLFDNNRYNTGKGCKLFCNIAGVYYFRNGPVYRTFMNRY